LAFILAGTATQTWSC